MVGDHRTVFRGPVGTGFDVVQLRRGNMVEVGLVFPDVWTGRLLCKQEPAAGHPVL